MTDRQGRDLPLDAHLHTELSPDSDVQIDVYAAQAVERGIAEIAITDHVDFEPGAPAFGYATFEQREALVRGAADRWAGRGVIIRFGAELTYDRSWEEDLRQHLRRYQYDFTIGSWHDRVRSPYTGASAAAWVRGRSLADVVGPAFEEVAAAARSGLFDAIGHIDVVKRYLHPHLRTADLAEAPELYEPILRALIDSGTALEVNTSGLRHAVAETYPSPAIVAVYRSMGGRSVTVGSDAHRGAHFAWGLADGYDAIAAAGIEQLTVGRAGSSRHLALPGLHNIAVGPSL